MCSAARGMPGECALLLLTGYTGLAIQEAATLSRSSGKGSLATLRRAKSGDLVLVATPKSATEALAVTASSGLKHFFETGRPQPSTMAKHWRTRLGRVADAAEG